MGRMGYGVFDSDSAMDTADELAPLIGIDLFCAGYPCDNSKLGEDEMPILSIADSAAHLNNGNLATVFNALKTDSRQYELVLFVLMCMKVGANIDKKYLKYVKKIYKTLEDWEDLPECRAQIRFALKEYKSGEPYKLRNFDPEGEYAEKAPPSSDSEMREIPCPRKLQELPKGIKRCRKCVEDCIGHEDDTEEEKEPNAKKAKTIKSVTKAD